MHYLSCYKSCSKLHQASNDDAIKCRRVENSSVGIILTESILSIRKARALSNGRLCVDKCAFECMHAHAYSMHHASRLAVVRHAWVTWNESGRRGFAPPATPPPHEDAGMLIETDCFPHATLLQNLTVLHKDVRHVLMAALQ
eukprot:1146649-Pelagomonas_calceolata.AAC.2